jgi:hypothetical protein
MKQRALRYCFTAAALLFDLGLLLGLLLLLLAPSS